MLHCVGPSLEIVTHLILERILVHSPTFVTFIGHFLHLDYLLMVRLGPPVGAGSAGDLDRVSPDRVVPTRPHGEFHAADVVRIEERKEDFDILLERRGSVLCMAGFLAFCRAMFWIVGGTRDLRIPGTQTRRCVKLSRPLIAHRS